MKIITQLIRHLFSFEQENNRKLKEALPKKTVLLAEDNPIIVLPIKNMLERQGYHVTAVEDGNKALRYLKSYTYSWGLLDLMLPEMDALDLVENYRVWEKQVNKPYIPIFGLTGYPFEKMELACKESGMNLVFGKPFQLGNLKCIENLIKNPQEAQLNSSKKVGSPPLKGAN